MNWPTTTAVKLRYSR